MEHGTMLAAGLIAFATQFFNSYKRCPTWVVKGTLLLIGVLHYAGNHGWPAGTFAAITDWLEVAVVSGLALPGAASMIGMLPGFKTDSKQSV